MMFVCPLQKRLSSDGSQTGEKKRTSRPSPSKMESLTRNRLEGETGEVNRQIKHLTSKAFSWPLSIVGKGYQKTQMPEVLLL